MPLNNILPVTNVFNLSPAVGVIVLPAVAAFLFSLAALALKRANQLGVDVWQTAFVVNISAGAIYSALWFVGGPSVRMELWYQPVLIAICLFVGMLAQFMALSRGDVSVAVPGFCKAATLEEIRGHNHVLTPGRYVGAADVEDDDMPFAERFAALQAKLKGQFAESETLTGAILKKLAGVSVNG